MENLNVLNAPKTATFQMRIDPEVKSRRKRFFATADCRSPTRSISSSSSP